MRTPLLYPVGCRVAAYRDRRSPCRARVIAVDGDLRTLREIENKNTFKGVNARAKYRYPIAAAFTLPLDQLALEGPPEADGPAYTVNPPFVPAGEA